MAAPKKPADHKPKVQKVQVTVGEGDAERTIPARRVEVRGITVTIADEVFDDFELLDDLAQLEDKKASRFPAVARRMFGDEYRIVLDGLRDETTGRVPLEAAAEFIRDVFEALNPN